MKDENSVKTPTWERILAWTVPTAVGGGIGHLLHLLPTWGLRLPFAPFSLAERLPAPWSGVVVVAIGAVFGLVVGYLINKEALTVRLSATDVVLARPGVVRTISREDVHIAYPDGDKLVLLGPVGEELAREPAIVLRKPQLAELFGEVWRESDPYAHSYLRWSHDKTDVPVESAMLFAARQRALDKKDGDEARALRAELGRMGFVVRDEKRQQHFRRAGA